MHGWLPHTVRQLLVLVGADVDERRDVAVVRAAKKEKKDQSKTQITGPNIEGSPAFSG